MVGLGLDEAVHETALEVLCARPVRQLEPGVPDRGVDAVDVERILHHAVADAVVPARGRLVAHEHDPTDEYRSRSLQICSARGIGISPSATAMPRPVVPFDTPIESCTSQATVLPLRFAFSTHSMVSKGVLVRSEEHTSE